DDRSTPTPPPAPPGRGRPSLGKPAGAGRGRPGRAGGCHPGGRRARESHRSGEVGSILERRCFRGLPCPERGRCCPAASGRGRPGQGAGPDPFPAPCPTAGRTAAGILPLGSFGGAPRRPGPPARVPPPPSGLGPGDRPPSPPLSGPAAGCSGKAPGGFRWIGGRPVRPLPAEGDDVRETALRAFRAFRGALRAEGLDCRDVLLVYLYVRDVDRFSAVDSAYAAVFDGRPPARVCVEAPLASGGAAADGRPGPGAARPGRSCGCGASRTGRPPASRPLQPERRGGRAGVLLRADRAPALHHAAGGRRRRSRGPRRPGPRPENPGRLAAGPPAPPRAVCPLLRHPQRLRPGRAGRLARRHRGTRPGGRAERPRGRGSVPAGVGGGDGAGGAPPAPGGCGGVARGGRRRRARPTEAPQVAAGHPGLARRVPGDGGRRSVRRPRRLVPVPAAPAGPPGGPGRGRGPAGGGGPAGRGLVLGGRRGPAAGRQGLLQAGRRGPGGSVHRAAAAAGRAAGRDGSGAGHGPGERHPRRRDRPRDLLARTVAREAIALPPAPHGQDRRGRWGAEPDPPVVIPGLAGQAAPGAGRRTGRWGPAAIGSGHGSGVTLYPPHPGAQSRWK
uniref:Uncharacterized protein n=1 Tax=Ornithorhynchus anatinus TaxID=9258 RepID=A0A6I8P7L9_ORNAN